MSDAAFFLRHRRGLERSLRLTLLIAFAAIIVFPYAWMLLTSFKSTAEVFSPGMRLLPESWRVENYREVLRTGLFARYVLNSIVVTSFGVVIELCIAFLGGYALARIEFPGRNVVFILVLGTLMIPPPLLMLPSYLVVGKLGWLNSYAGLVIPRAGSAFGVFLMRQFMMTVPRELEEAAQVDGARTARVLLGVYLPICFPSLVTVGVFSMIGFWNDYYWPLVVTSDDRMRTLALGIGHFKSLEGMGRWELLMAAGVIATIPMLVAFLCARKALISNLTGGAIKG